MRRLLVVVAVGMMVSAAGAQTWDCGEYPNTKSVKATLNGGTLTVKGAGPINGYHCGKCCTPWIKSKKSITNVVIENGVTAIGEAAFNCLTSLTSVTIPNSVTSIVGSYAFGGCTNLKSINVATGNANYSSEDGVLFNKDKTVLLEYPKGKQGAYTIPNSVTSISIGEDGGAGFNSCIGLTSITIPNSVTSGLEGPFTFYGCTKLESIEVETGNANYSSENGVLFNKDKTELLSYPNRKQGAYTIPNSVKSLNMGVFGSGLTSLTIPNTVESVVMFPTDDEGGGGSAGCTNLTSITILSSTPPEWLDEFPVVMDHRKVCFYVPSGSIDAYRSVPSFGPNGWFRCIKEVAAR